jgi:hypothetical protein
MSNPDFLRYWEDKLPALMMDQRHPRVPIGLILVNQVTLHHSRRNDGMSNFCEIPGFWNFSQE